MRYFAEFTPEAWINDYAIAVDPEGDTVWDCTAFAIENQDYLLRMEEEDSDPEDGVLDIDDVFKGDPAAPEWIREWQGPFTIRVRKEIA